MNANTYSILNLAGGISLEITIDMIRVVKGDIVIDEVKIVSCSETSVLLELRGNTWICTDQIYFEKMDDGIIKVIMISGYISSQLPFGVTSNYLSRYKDP